MDTRAIIFLILIIPCVSAIGCLPRTEDDCNDRDGGIMKISHPSGDVLASIFSIRAYREFEYTTSRETSLRPMDTIMTSEAARIFGHTAEVVPPPEREESGHQLYSVTIVCIHAPVASNPDLDQREYNGNNEMVHIDCNRSHIRLSHIYVVDKGGNPEKILSQRYYRWLPQDPRLFDQLQKALD